MAIDAIELLELIQRPDKTQEIDDFTSAVAVTLRNPQAVENPTDTAGNIAIKYAGDTAYRTTYVPAGGVVLCEASHIGATGDGTTVTRVIVKGKVSDR